MTLTEQIAYLQERAAQFVSVAKQVDDIPLLRERALEDAAALTTVANTLIAERQRRADHVADWS